MSNDKSYITKPIDSLAELVKWQYDVPNLLTIPLQKCDFYWDDTGRKHSSSDIPQIIYCHDMAGGYLESDKTTGFTTVFPAFRFIRWHLIDIFIYFSHHFITIPPISWINLAHRQGVRVYGTFIIESNDNEAFQTVFLNLPSNETSHIRMNYQELAYRLNEIRHLIGFEGWLINLEVSLPGTKLAEARQRISNFLRLLKTLGSEIVWYDAVCWSGHLSYQNCLTNENKPFFEACQGGLFLNYNWDSRRLKTTQTNADSSAMSSRVFVGIDCFGRGCPGGGGFGTSIALKMILDAVHSIPTRPLSVALFAPGWVFEKCIPPDYDTNPTNAMVELSQTDWKFWSILEPLIDQLRGASRQTLIFRPSLICLPVVSESGQNWVDQFVKPGLLFRTYCCSGQGIFPNPDDSAMTRTGSCLNWQQIVPTCRDLTSNCDSPNYQVTHWFSPGCQPGTSTCLRVHLVQSSSKLKTSPIYMELFSFGPNILLSNMARFNLTISPCLPDGFNSEDNGSKFKNDTMGFQLFVDRAKENGPIQRTTSYPLSDTLVVQNNKLWLNLEFDLAHDLPLIRLGLTWIPSVLDSYQNLDGFLISQLEVTDPNWPFEHACDL